MLLVRTSYWVKNTIFLVSFTWSKQAKQPRIMWPLGWCFFDSVWGVLKCWTIHYCYRKKLSSLEEQEKKLRNKSNAQSSPKRKRLHELFRPPIDILHHGDFQSVYQHFRFHGTQCCEQYFRAFWKNVS